MKGKLFKHVCAALCAAFAVAGALLLIGAAVALRFDDPLSVTGAISFAVLIVSALTGGVVAARVERGTPLIAALIFALAFCFVHFCVHVILGGNAGAARIAVGYGCVIVVSVLAALIFRRRSGGGSRSGVKKLRKRAIRR